MTNPNDQEREALEAAWEQRGVPPDVPGSVWRVGQALRDEFEAGYLAALAAREEPHFDEVIISREEYEQIRHARGFVGFVAALGDPRNAGTRQQITLTKLIEKAQAALSLAAREDTERPDHETLVERLLYQMCWPSCGTNREAEVASGCSLSAGEKRSIADQAAWIVEEEIVLAELRDTEQEHEG
jgi:hypothetical protein